MPCRSRFRTRHKSPWSLLSASAESDIGFFFYDASGGSHFLDRAASAGWVHRPGGISDQVDLEAFLQGIQHCGPYAHILRQATDPDAPYAAASEQVGQTGAREGRVVVPLRIRALADGRGIGRESQRDRKFRAP